MKKNDYIKKLKELKACDEAIKYSLNFDTSQEAWDNCNRGDWMAWMAGKHAGLPWSEKRKKLVLVSCKFTRLVWDKLPQASKDCVELFEQWAGGKDILKDELIKAKRAAYADVANIANIADVADVANIANIADVANIADIAYVADIANIANIANIADIADVAGVADVAYAAYAATAATTAYAARKETLAKCAIIMRKHYPNIDDLFKEQTDLTDDGE